MSIKDFQQEKKKSSFLNLGEGGGGGFDANRMYLILVSYLKIERGFVHAILLYLIRQCMGNTAHAKREQELPGQADLGDFQFAGGL